MTRSLNGWRRLWLALTALAVIIAAITGLVQAGRDDSSWIYASAIRKDFENPACRDIATKPFSELAEPAFTSEGGSCWHIFTHRRYRSDLNQPLTMDLYYHDRLVDRWQNIGILVGIYLVMVVLGSAIIYALGKTVAWIRAGFRNA
ncbi:hypothetical protein [Rhizobium sp. BK251]|uniref:hypothetical protein n=1 Tax=Rhizobium sp. BK251 TaxID=2512125 RepID=UPI00104D8885|nr:hypothetical protein [Rhizobium sp. BK251]TCL74455.1 hypothetical protein EV286_10215 [Rhizobium sp. BK251]